MTSSYFQKYDSVASPAPLDYSTARSNLKQWIEKCCEKATYDPLQCMVYHASNDGEVIQNYITGTKIHVGTINKIVTVRTHNWYTAYTTEFKSLKETRDEVTSSTDPYSDNSLPFRRIKLDTDWDESSLLAFVVVCTLCGADPHYVATHDKSESNLIDAVKKLIVAETGDESAEACFFTL